MIKYKVEGTGKNLSSLKPFEMNGYAFSPHIHSLILYPETSI